MATEEEEDYLIFEENYDYNPDAYKYGDIDGKRLRVSIDNWWDIWSWKICKTRDSYWFKMKPCLHTNKADGYKKYSVTINRIPRIMSRVLFKLYNKNWDITDNSNMNQIDHKNQNSLDNRIENLRVFTNQQNQCNKTFRGTRLLKSGKWQARIRYDGKSKSKNFGTEPEAHEQYLIWKELYHSITE